MSRLLDQQRPFLELYVRAGLKQRRALIQTLSDSQLRVLSEIVHNVLVGNVPLTPEQQKVLKKYRSVLYVVGDKSIERDRKWQALQKGANPIKFVLETALPHLPWRTSPS
jgi:hypothetical protein